jgi:hypothetical protein
MLSPWQDSTSTAGMSTWRRRPGVGPVAGRTAASQPEAWRRGRREPRVRPRSSRSSICPAAHLRRLLVPRSRKYAMSVTASPTATASSAAVRTTAPPGTTATTTCATRTPVRTSQATLRSPPPTAVRLSRPTPTGPPQRRAHSAAQQVGIAAHLAPTTTAQTGQRPAQALQQACPRRPGPGEASWHPGRAGWPIGGLRR